MRPTGSSSGIGRRVRGHRRRRRPARSRTKNRSGSVRTTLGRRAGAASGKSDRRPAGRRGCPGAAPRQPTAPVAGRRRAAGRPRRRRVAAGPDDIPVRLAGGASSSVRPSSSASACSASGKSRTRSAARSAVERTSMRTGSSTSGTSPSRSISPPSSCSSRSAMPSSASPLIGQAELGRGSACTRSPAAATSPGSAPASRSRSRSRRAAASSLADLRSRRRRSRAALPRRSLRELVQVGHQGCPAPATIFVPRNAARAGSWNSRAATCALVVPHLLWSVSPSGRRSACRRGVEEVAVATPKSSQIRLSRVGGRPGVAGRVQAEARLGRVLRQREPPRRSRRVDLALRRC